MVQQYTIFVVNYLREFLAECDEAEADLQFKTEDIREREVFERCYL